ncbi:MAG: hypothetical protein J5772_06525 [Clostridia bacterium]|nr:hypothetical protein [Clostridia bacterium]
MKKTIAAALCIILAFSLFGCASPVSSDRPAAIRIGDTIYYSTGRAIPVEPDESAIRHTTSYAENGIPSKDGEDNFNRETGTPYATIDGGTIVVLINNEWIEFRPEE